MADGAGTAGAALVTGAAVRLGRAMVLDLARRGHDVAIHYGRSAAEAEATAEEARAFGVRAATLGADLLDETATQALVPAAAEALGRPLTVLVNNASIFEYDRLETATRRVTYNRPGSSERCPISPTITFVASVPTSLSASANTRSNDGTETMPGASLFAGCTPCPALPHTA